MNTSTLLTHTTNPEVDALHIRQSININEQKLFFSYFMSSIYCCRYYQIITEIATLQDFLITPMLSIDPTLKSKAKLRIEAEYESNLIKFSYTTLLKRIIHVKSLYQREVISTPEIDLTLFIQKNQSKTREAINKFLYANNTLTSSTLTTPSKPSSSLETTHHFTSPSPMNSPSKPPSTIHSILDVSSPRSSPRNKRKKTNQLLSSSKKKSTTHDHTCIDTSVIRSVPTIPTMNNITIGRQTSLCINQIQQYTNNKATFDQIIDSVKKKFQLDSILSPLPEIINNAYMQTNAKARLHLNWSINFGFTTQAKGANGFNINSIDGRSCHDWQYASAPSWQKQVWDISVQLIPLIDCDYFKNFQYCIQVSLCGEGDYAEINTDSKDVDYQIMVCMGDYGGGQLRAYNESLSKYIDYDLRGTLTPFDPRLPHSILPVTRGRRYSLIIYRHHDDNFINAQPIIDYVDASPNAVCVNYPTIKSRIEEVALGWIKNNISLITTNSGKQIFQILQASPFHPHMKDRVQLKEFVCHVNQLMSCVNAKLSFKESKFIFMYILIYYLSNEYIT